MNCSKLVCWAVACFGLSITSASGAIIAYEGFDYDPDGADLLGANGGSGFSSPWKAGGFNASIHNNYDREADPIAFGALLHTPPTVRTGAVNAIAGLTRDLTAPLGQGNSTVYLSFLVQPVGTLGAGAFNGFFGLVLESAGEPELFIGKPGGGALNRWVIEDRGGSLQHASTLEPVVGETALLVLKAEFAAAGNDRFTLYVNPAPGGPEPAAGVVKFNSNLGLVRGLTLYSTGAMVLDEIRVGETFADVTRIPEPAAWGLAVAATAALWRPRRR